MENFNSKTTSYSTEALCLDTAYKNATNDDVRQDIRNNAKDYIGLVSQTGTLVSLKNSALIADILKSNAGYIDSLDLSEFYNTQDYSSLLTIEQGYNFGLKKDICNLLNFCDTMIDTDTTCVDSTSYAGHIIGKVACLEELAQKSDENLAYLEAKCSEPEM